MIATMTVRAKAGSPWPEGTEVVINANMFDPAIMEKVSGRAKLTDIPSDREVAEEAAKLEALDEAPAEAADEAAADEAAANEDTANGVAVEES